MGILANKLRDRRVALCELLHEHLGFPDYDSPSAFRQRRFVVAQLFDPLQGQYLDLRDMILDSLESRER